MVGNAVHVTGLAEQMHSEAFVECLSGRKVYAGFACLGEEDVPRIAPFFLLDGVAIQSQDLVQKRLLMLERLVELLVQLRHSPVDMLSCSLVLLPNHGYHPLHIALSLLLLEGLFHLIFHPQRARGQQIEIHDVRLRNQKALVHCRVNGLELGRRQ
ncbi:hypothetical protein Mapa_009679 [Marchantia paleacea]|nr:hypothetical protein Mapa_009679 [Marchantia paleacea]